MNGEKTGKALGLGKMLIGKEEFDIKPKTGDIRTLLQGNAKMQIKIANNKRVVDTLLNRKDLDEGIMKLVNKYEREVEDILENKLDERLGFVKKLLLQSGISQDKIEKLEKDHYLDMIKDNVVEIALGLVDPEAEDEFEKLKN